MIKKVVKGDIYAVATESECVVTSSTGKPLGTATAGNPITFPATTDEVEISDPDADFIRVNPNYAPVKLKLLGLLGGGVQTLPAGYIAAEFLDIYRSIGSVPIFTVSPETLKPELEAVVRMREDSYSDYTFLTDDNHQFAISLYIAWTPLMRWDYAGEMLTKGALSPNKIYTVRKVGEKNYVDGALICENSKKTLSQTTKVYLARSYTPKFALYSLKADNSVDEKRDFMPALTSAGKPCLFDKVSKQTFEVSCGVGFTLAQALNLSKLPATGGSLTVSLPWEAQLIASGVPAILQAAADRGWTITVQYREPEADNAYYNKYAECVTVADMLAVNPDYKNDLTADGAWIYPLPKLQNAEMAFASMRCKSAKFYMPELVRGRRIFQLLSGKSTTYAESVEAYAPKLILKSNYYEGVEIIFLEARIRELKVEFSPATTYISKDFAIFGLQNFEMNEMPNLTGLPGAFQNAELNKTSILRLIAQLPTWESGSHLATFGIHTDLQTDEEVIEAITNAETKGWNVTVQWNGTPTVQTASTFGLRRPTIYAKLGTVARPDGTTENVLDWGHYVTDWEANGYQEFASVEEAKEYFNINQTEA